MAERIPNEIFRHRYKDLEECEGLALSEVSERMGFIAYDKKTGRRKPDSSRVARMLGLAKDGQKSVSYENAVALCDALHIEYTDANV